MRSSCIPVSFAVGLVNGKKSNGFEREDRVLHTHLLPWIRNHDVTMSNQGHAPARGCIEPGPLGPLSSQNLAAKMAEDWIRSRDA